jgi:tetratricopeptide (TPR) repeat protein
MNRKYSPMYVAALIFASAVGPLYAQVYVQNGTAQDANNLVGSGGSNNPIQGYVPSNPNIYGLQNSGAAYNPAGMPQFSKVVPVPLPGGGTTYAQIPVVGASSFRSSSFSPSQARLSSVNAVSQGVSSLAVNNAINGAFNPNQGYAAQIGAGLGVSTSLTGIGATQVNSPISANGQGLSFFNSNVSLPTNPQAYAGMATGSSGEINPLFGLRPMNGALISGQRNKTALNGKRKSYSTMKVNGRLASDRALGLASNKQRNNALNQRNQGLVGYAPRKHVPSGDYYQRLLMELSSGRRSKIVAPGIGGAPAITNTTLAPESAQQAQQLMIDPITGLPIAPITAKRTVGTPNTPAAAQGTSSPGYPAAGSQAASRNWLSPQMTKKLKAGRRVQPLSNLAGPTPNAFNRYMKRGQIDLKQGRYIAALYRFNSALIVNPGNELARLARANTELMGGMYASAYADFKTAFAHHPELTSLRYNWAHMLPPHAVKNTQAQLKRMVPDQSNAAAFLLAYTYYQTGHMHKLRALLSLWSSWGTGSLWPSILNKAWLAGPDRH